MREKAISNIDGRTIRAFWLESGEEVRLWYRPGALLPSSAEYFGAQEGVYYDMGLTWQKGQDGAPILWEYDGAPDVPEAVARVLSGPLGLRIDEDVFDTAAI